MDFLVDVHLPISLSKFLNNQPNCTAIHVNQILQKWHTTDTEICKYADENFLVVVSKDSDFKNSFFINKTPRRVIRVALGNLSNKELIDQFEKHLAKILSLEAKPHFYIDLGTHQLSIVDW